MQVIGEAVLLMLLILRWAELGWSFYGFFLSFSVSHAEIFVKNVTRKQKKQAVWSIEIHGDLRILHPKKPA